MSVACAPPVTTTALTVQRVAARDAAGSGGADRPLLGGLGLGLWQSTGGLGALPLPLLGGRGPCADAWFGAARLHCGHSGAVQWRHDGHWLHGVLDVPEREADAGDLAPAARAAYRDMFAALRETGMPHLQRVWNYLPRINDPAQGMERYLQFNLGRQRAFIEAGHDAFAGAPAACAIGTGDDAGRVLRVRFLAGRTAPLAVENPRQVPAYRYPAQYGPRSPSFSRAVLLQAGPGAPVLSVSGTASIVGHASLHAGDVRAQTRESLANLAAVVAAAGAWCPVRLCLADMACTIYVRHADDYGAVRGEFEALLGAHSMAAQGAVYLRADICRSELLVEIEGHLGTSRSMPT